LKSPGSSVQGFVITILCSLVKSKSKSFFLVFIISNGRKQEGQVLNNVVGVLVKKIVNTLIIHNKKPSRGKRELLLYGINYTERRRRLRRFSGTDFLCCRSGVSWFAWNYTSIVAYIHF